MYGVKKARIYKASEFLEAVLMWLLKSNIAKKRAFLFIYDLSFFLTSTAFVDTNDKFNT